MERIFLTNLCVLILIIQAKGKKHGKNQPGTSKASGSAAAAVVVGRTRSQRGGKGRGERGRQGRAVRNMGDDDNYPQCFLVHLLQLLLTTWLKLNHTVNTAKSLSV